MILTPLQKLHKNVGDLGKFIVAKCFEWLPKVQKIAQSGHTDLHEVQTSNRSFGENVLNASFKDFTSSGRDIFKAKKIVQSKCAANK